MDSPQWPPGFTSPPSQPISPAPRSTSRNSHNSPAPAQSNTMASYPPTYGFSNQSPANSSVPNPNAPNPSQQSISRHSSPMSMISQTQSNRASYIIGSTPAMNTPAMGYPTLSYNKEQIDDAREAARNRFGIDAQAASQLQKALEDQYLLLLHQKEKEQRQHEQKQYYQQMRQQWQKHQQHPQIHQQASASVPTTNQHFLTVPQQQRREQQKHQQQRHQYLQHQFPPLTAEQQQQYLQLQTPVASPNQTSSPVIQQQNNEYQRLQQHNVQQHSVQQPGIQKSNIQPHNNLTSASTASTTPPPPPPSPATAAPDDRFNLDPALLQPPPPLIEPHPLSKSIHNLVLMHHPLPGHVVDRLSMTTASSLQRLCADFEYRDLSADYPIALTAATRAWLAAHLRALNAARRESGRRLCERWQRCVRERATTKVDPGSGEVVVDWVQQEEVEVPGGSEEECRMLDWEAREALGNFMIPDDRILVMPLVRPGWDFLQLRQVRGPSAKEWEDFVVDDVGELRRQRENREREEKEARERQERSSDGEDDEDEVTIVGSRVLSSDEMKAAAAQRSTRPVKQPPSKNIAAASKKPKKASLKETAQKKTHGRKKSAATKAKDGRSKPSAHVEVNSPPQQTPVQINTAPTQSAPQISDYPPIYGEAPQSNNQNISVAAPTIDLTASASSPSPALVSDYPPIYTTDTAAPGLPDYPHIYATSTTTPERPDYPPIHAPSTSAPEVSDYGPIFATDGTVEEPTISPGIQPSTTATAPSVQPYSGPIYFSGIDDFFSAGTDYGSMAAAAATGASSQASSALQNQTLGSDSRDGGDVAAEGYMPQVDGAFELVNVEEDEKLDDLFEGEIDE